MPVFTPDDLRKATGGSWINELPADFTEVNGVCTDSRADCTGTLFLALCGENFDGHTFIDKAVASGAAALCVDKAHAGTVSAPIPVLAVDDTTSAYQDIAGYYRRSLKDLKVVALTGSSGKTSTKEMLRAVFAEAYGEEHVYATKANTNNHIGVPSNLLNLTREHKIAVIEMGTNHFGEIKPLSRTVRPNAALVTSIGNCHLEFFGSTDGVAKEKSAIFSFLSADGTAVLPSECPGLEILEEKSGAFKKMHFGTDTSSDVQVSYLGSTLKGSRFELYHTGTNKKVAVEWHLAGKHQCMNAAGAACAALAMGLDMDTIADGLAKTTLPGMRSKITERAGATWVNDAYNANPDSMKAAIAWLAEFVEPSKFVLIVGDMLELGEAAFDAHKNILDTAVKTFPGARIIAVGPMMTKAGAEISEVKCFDNSKSAVDEVRAMIKDGDTVFLKASRGTRLELIEPGD